MKETNRHVKETNRPIEGFEEDAVHDDAKNDVPKFKDSDNVLEFESSDQKYIMSKAPCFTSTLSKAVPTSAVTSSSCTFQERIQCDQCARKCVNKSDLEHHIYLWHTDAETQILMARNLFATSDT